MLLNGWKLVLEMKREKYAKKEDKEKRRLFFDG